MLISNSFGCNEDKGPRSLREVLSLHQPGLSSTALWVNPSEVAQSDSATPWTAPYQAPPSIGFSRQEYWSGSPFPSPGDLPDPGTETRSPALRVDALPSATRKSRTVLNSKTGALRNPGSDCQDLGLRGGEGTRFSWVPRFSRQTRWGASLTYFRGARTGRPRESHAWKMVVTRSCRPRAGNQDTSVESSRKKVGKLESLSHFF